MDLQRRVAGLGERIHAGEQRLDLAVNSGEVGLWYCDLPFDILVWSPVVKEHFGLPADAVQTVDDFGRDGATQLMQARGLVDVLVPRGSASSPAHPPRRCCKGR